MNLMNALLKTYDYALENDLVDNHELGEKGQVLLPVYHSNRRSNGNDIFEITIDENSNPVGGKFLDKDDVVVFPITEESITRSGAKKAPHAICDELSYLANKIDPEKNEIYMDGIEDLLDYENENNNENLRIIGGYIKKNTILEDFLKLYMGTTEYTYNDKFVLKYEAEESGKIRERSINLSKIFITFKIKKLLSSDIKLTRDIGIHEFYIDYINDRNKQSGKMMNCNITGKIDHCIERHRGVIGNAKLISISNNDETYYGRFKKGEDVYHIGFEASQKVHNMLKYLVDSDNHKKFIGGDAYVVNWLSNDLDKGGIDLISGQEEDVDDFEEVEEITMSELGGRMSNKVGRYFFGDGEDTDTKSDFYILVIEKISNGRVSIKYFRRLSKSEAYKRVSSWYSSTSWKFYGKDRSPTIFEVVNFVYGQENSKGYLSCENKKLMRSTIERLVPCIIDSQKLPRDISRSAFYKLSNKQSYKKSWDMALNIGCSIIKKHKHDYESYDINPDKISEVKQLKGNISFNYGKLMAIYEKIELDAVRGRAVEGSKKGQAQRITNSDRLWNSMIRTPERTRFILESKIKPYMNMLKKNNPGSYVFYDKLITSITLELINIDEANKEKKGSLNEDFILGYYYQKNDFYRKRDKDIESVDEK